MWARIVSVVFHPLFMPTYFFSLLAWALPASLEPITTDLHLKFLFFIFIITCLLPSLNVGIFRTFGSIRSLVMRERRERLLPFVFISGIYVAVTVLFYSQVRMNLHDNFLKFMVIIDMLVIVATLATFFFKVSVHAVAVWGFVGILLPLAKITEVNTILYPAVALIVLAGVVMSARLRVGAHTSREVMWGSILGLATGVVGMLLLF